MVVSRFLPYFFAGKVVSGFGRGGKQLGCPTANVDDSAVAALPSEMPCGVFYGLARVECGEVCDMVMSIGWNPQFQNDKKSIEVHLLHDYPSDFYGSKIEGVAIGYIRPMKRFNNLDDLIEAIHNDISLSKANLQKIDRKGLIEQFFPRKAA